MSTDMSREADGAAARGHTFSPTDATAIGTDLSGRWVNGRWVNDGGTVIDLRSHDDGRVSGTVKFGAVGLSYQLFPLRGTCVIRPGGQRGIVGTVPGWPKPSSLIVWCGELDTEGSVLSTKLLSAGVEQPHAEWDGVCGGSEFHRARAVPRRRSA